MTPEGPTTMPENFRTPPPTLSTELAGAAAVVGRAMLESETVLRQAMNVAELTRRRFRFEGDQILHGTAELPPGGLVFEGTTTYPPPYMRPDPLSPTLHLDGQRFFDEEHEAGPLPTLLLIGGPPVPASAGFDEPAAGPPVRPFLLQGADRTLVTALPSLLGWQPEISTAAVERTLEAGHPLIPLDALRIAARQEGDAAHVEILAGWLLHPTQPPEAKVIALDLVAQALRRLRPGSREADSLVALTLWNWRLERWRPANAAYLEAWILAAPQVKASSAARELKAMALDETAAERVSALQAELRKKL